MPPFSRRLRISGLLALAIFPAAAFAEEPLAPAQDWSGWYAGAEIGGSWGGTDWRFLNDNYFNTLGSAVLGYPFDIGPDGLTGGVFGGVNRQFGAWVLGGEIALARSGFSEDIASPYFPASDTYSMDIAWIATASAKLGYAWGDWLLYGKGGWAGGQVDLRLDDQPSEIFSTSDSWAHGWTAGFGLDYAVADGLVIGVGYSHIELDTGRQIGNCPRCGTGVGLGSPAAKGNAEIDAVTLRVGFEIGQ